jgi:hypothetical protein
VRTAGLALFLFAWAAVPTGAVIWLGLGLLGSRGKRRLTFTLFLLVFVGPALIYLRANFLRSSPYWYYIAIGWAVLLAAVIFSGFVQHDPWTLTADALMVWAAALAVVFLCAISFLQHRGADLANDLFRGRPPYMSQFIFQIQREPVCVVTDGDVRAAVLLGQSDSGVVLFDRVQRVVQRPAARPDLVSRPAQPGTC